MLRPTVIDELVRRARRRILWNGILAQFAFAACVAMGSAVLLLVAGTQLLDWRWLALVTALSLGAGTYRATRRIPSSYRAAQTVDAAAGLKDALSTAVFFATDTRRRVPQPIRAAQREAAERSARGVNLSQAIPFMVPRSLYALAGLALVASSLFALRYGVERRINLRPPLARLVMPWLGLNPEVFAEAHKDAARKRDAKDSDERRAQESKQDGRDRPNSAPEQSLEGIDVPEVDDTKSSATVTAEDRQELSEGQQSEEMEQLSDEGESGEGQEGEMASSKNGKQDDEASDRKPTSAPAESSLMAKLRDAMANLMSRMNIQPKTAGNPTPSNKGQQQARAGNQKEGNGQRGQSQGQGQKQSGEGGQESQDGQQGDESGNAQTADGKNASRGGEDSSRNAASGVGRQDGSKDVRMAEQLAAMGKISEIIGKRTANVSGEITVEVRSGRQTLRTAYSKAGSAHGDSGGEIHRDEVPVAYQHYVQQYFAEVRKAAKP